MSEPTPVRVQRRRTKGFNLQAASPNGLPVVYVGRPTPWGNYCASLRDFKFHAAYKAQTDPAWLAPLRGKNLACWCDLEDPCHADILLELANR